MSFQSTAKRTRSKPWYAHITLDLLLRVLSRSIFHPAITLIFYLCLASVHQHTTPLAYSTLYYTAFLAVVEIAIWLNHRFAYGKSRTVDWESEVVVVTGGGSGLGRVLVEMLVRKGVKVGVLELRDADAEALELMESGDLCWETCDVAKAEEVVRSVERVTDELGPPTILVNNAATAITGLPLLSSSTKATALSASQAARTISINAISHFNTLSAVLPHLQSALNGGTVVTISSILSHLDPAMISDYAASKSAVSSLHHSLEHEIRAHPDADVRRNLKTVLVEIGQMDTTLFSDITTVPWYADFFGPVLDAKDVASDIVRMLDRGDSGVIRTPFYAKLMPWYGAMPCSLQVVVRWFSGIDKAIGGPYHRKTVAGSKQS